MKYAVQRIEISEISGVRYVAEEIPFFAENDDEAKAKAEEITASWDEGSQSALKRRNGNQPTALGQ